MCNSIESWFEKDIFKSFHSVYEYILPSMWDNKIFLRLQIFIKFTDDPLTMDINEYGTIRLK